MIAKIATAKDIASAAIKGLGKQKLGKQSLTTGELAEKNAGDYLHRQGLKLITKNFRCKYGEIDLIMQDGETLVFVEVRFRKNNQYGSALDSVNAAKQNKIRIAAQHYLLQHKLNESQAIRFDVVGMMPGDIQWIKNAF